MKTWKSFYLLALAATLAFTGCKKDDEGASRSGELTVGQTEYTLGAAEDRTAAATFTAPADWTLTVTYEDAADWLTVTPASGTAGEQTVELREAEAVLRDAAREVERLLALAESPDPEAFYRRHAAGQEREALERRREDIEDALRLAARDMGAEDFEAFLASFGEADREALEARLAELGGRLAALAEEDERLADAARTLDVRLEQAAASDTLSRARQRASSLAGTIRELALEWSRCALARYLLLEARGRFEKERQPGVVRTASSLFAAITGGAWSGIAASLEDSSLRVLPPHGEPVSPEVLSRGTQEQLYLALRLAQDKVPAATKPLAAADCRDAAALEALTAAFLAE